MEAMDGGVGRYPVRSRRGDAGSALAEVMVAAALLVTVAASLSQIVAGSVRASAVARTRTAAVVSAAQKMEQLRGLEWNDAIDPGSGARLPFSDVTTDLSTDPETSAGPGLLPSPAGTLDANAAHYVDYLDGDGRWVGHGTAPPTTAVYTRRWSVQTLDADPDNTIVLQVLVTASRDPPGPSGSQPRRLEADARLMSVRTRRAR